MEISFKFIFIISRGQQSIRDSWLINECVIEQRGLGRVPYIWFSNILTKWSYMVVCLYFG
jgi:hypothetical protein